MTKRERQILTLVRSDPMISQQAIAERIGISRSAVAGHIMRLTDKGIIRGRGYVVDETPFVAVIGGVNLDIHGLPDTELRMADSNPGVVRTAPGGVARNIAENLARLGADCRLIAAVGTDTHGDMLLQHGRDAGIDMRHMLQLESLQTSTYLALMKSDGDMQVAVSDMKIADELTARRLQQHEPMLRQAALIVLDTNLNDEALDYLTGTFAENTLFVDTVSTTKALRIEPYLKSVHTLKPALIEAEKLSGISVRSNKQLPGLADWFHERGVHRVFITLGENGVFYSAVEAQGIERQSRNQRVQNTGGAGDAFLAGLAFAWLRHWPLEKSTRFALAAASLTTAHSGTNNPAMSLAAVNRTLRSQHA